MKKRLSPKPLHLNFWIKTLLCRFWPGGIGYEAQLKKHIDKQYIHDRDKHPVRSKHHDREGWKNTKTQDGLQYRDYENYDEYVTHQKQKWSEMLKARGGLTPAEVANFRLKFFNRFRHLHELIDKNANIICAGARQGTEVAVLRDLGFKNAWGIDLNPGPDNPYVKPGDFMHLDAEDSTLDLIYCNAVDHAFDLNAFFKEHARAIQPDGYVLYDIAIQEGGGFEAVEWEHEEDVFKLLLKYFREVIHVRKDDNWKWILLRGKRTDSAPEK